jgi:hypothetical protein
MGKLGQRQPDALTIDDTGRSRRAGRTRSAMNNHRRAQGAEVHRRFDRPLN